MTEIQTPNTRPDRGRLRAKAKRAGLAGETQASIARRLGVHIATVGRWARADGWRLCDLRAKEALNDFKHLPVLDDAVALHEETPELVAEQLWRRTLWLEVEAAEATRQGKLQEGVILLRQSRRYRSLHRFYKAQVERPNKVPPDPRVKEDELFASPQEALDFYVRAVRDKVWRRKQGWPVTEKEKREWWKANAHLYGETAPEWWDRIEDEDEEEDEEDPEWVWDEETGVARHRDE